MAFINRVRLPIKLQKPQFVEDRDDYRLSNGETKTLFHVIRKVYEGVTDYMPEKIHERLKIALAHDIVSIEGDRYVGIITQEGSYDIEWQDFKNKPIAPAKFKANVTPYNATNSNCGTCEEYTQVIANDDDAGTLDEGQTYNINVIDNDDICCSPITVTITNINTTYLTSAVVEADNSITIVLKMPLSDINSISIVTYRVECANGMYDEANVIANINGTDPTPVCLAPTSPVLNSVDSDTSATFSWTAPSPAPSCGYYCEVRNIAAVVLASGTESGTSVTVTGLPSDADFLRFFVKSDCCAGLESNFAGPVIFSLPPPSDTESCGEYELYNSNFLFFRTVTYIDCNGDEQTVIVTQLNTKTICALQTSPGVPVELIPLNADITVTYIGLC
jgi:hypothetical protein